MPGQANVGTMTDQFDSLTPRDILITLRSLERRIGDVVGQVRSDPDLFAMIDQTNAAGRSFAEILSSGAQSTAKLAAAVGVAATATRKVSATDYEFRATQDRMAVESAQELVGRSTADLADALDSIEADDWGAEVVVDGKPDHSVVDLARETARRGVSTLRDLQTRLDQMTKSR